MQKRLNHLCVSLPYILNNACRDYGSFDGAKVSMSYIYVLVTMDV